MIKNKNRIKAKKIRDAEQIRGRTKRVKAIETELKRIRMPEEEITQIMTNLKKVVETDLYGPELEKVVKKMTDKQLEIASISKLTEDQAKLEDIEKRARKAYQKAEKEGAPEAKIDKAFNTWVKATELHEKKLKLLLAKKELEEKNK